MYFVAGMALAQSTYPTQTTQPIATEPSSGPAGIPVGPVTVFPGLNLGQGYDDNLFWTNNRAKSSSFTVVSPYVRAEAISGASKFDATLRIDDATYWSSRNDDYTDYSLLANGDLVFSGRSGLKLRLGALHGHDPRGSTDRPILLHPDEYDNYGMDGVFRYGSPGARGRIELDGGAYARRYTNNRLFTTQSDRDTSQAGGTFFWRAMPRTEILAQAQRRWIDYKDPNSTQSSTEDRFYVGARWEATAATTGYVKVGRLRKEFELPTRPGTTDPSWDVGVRWSPRSYSVFDFVTSKQTNESTGVGDFVDTKSYGVTWNHAWNSRVRTQVMASYRDDEFVGSLPYRRDKTPSVGLKASYDFRRWLLFGAEYTYWDRDSNLNINDYKRNLFLLTLRATL